MHPGRPFGLADPRVSCEAARRLCVRLLAVAALTFGLPIASAQTDTPTASEGSIKAAFLYKFAEYVDWPAIADSEQPFTIGVLGSTAIADELLRATANRTAHDRRIRIRQIEPAGDIDDLQILFIAGERRGELPGLLAPLRGKPILTVTESSGALTDGSVINFTVSGERVRFEVSLDSAETNRLRLNSRLLAVAANVRQSR